MNGNILIVDDNKAIRESLQMMLQMEYDHVDILSDPKTLLSTLSKTEYDLILLDMNFKTGINTGNEGLYWLSEIQKIDSGIGVIFITAYGDVELAVKAVKHGAFDFILKPWDNAKLLATVLSALRFRQTKKNNKQLQAEGKILKSVISSGKKDLIGQTSVMKEIRSIISKVAPTDANILIQGENGTGKEVLAREIHAQSKRKDEVLITIDLGAMSESLFESELFGHKKGSFTDAKSDRQGKIEAAHKGTLFLDEIGNLSLAMQAKLLTVLQNKKLTPIGGNKEIEIDFRLICATNMDLQKMVAEGSFREDLLYRINTINIVSPSLRDRKDDIELLARFFLTKYINKYQKEECKLSPENIQTLKAMDWPGNVRELEHCIEKAVILSEEGALFIQSSQRDHMVEPSLSDSVKTIEEMEELLIRKALKDAEGNMTKVAKQLGITRPTLYSKMKKYKL